MNIKILSGFDVGKRRLKNTICLVILLCILVSLPRAGLSEETLEAGIASTRDEAVLQAQRKLAERLGRDLDYIKFNSRVIEEKRLGDYVQVTVAFDYADASTAGGPDRGLPQRITSIAFGSEQVRMSVDDAIRFLGKEVVNRVRSRKTPVVVVTSDFVRADKRVTLLGRFLNDKLTAEIFLASGVELVERRHLKEILDELGLHMSGLVDSESAKKVGLMSGADVVVVGDILDLGNALKANIRLVDVETGAVLSAHNSIFKKDYLAKVLFETVQQNGKNN